MDGWMDGWIAGWPPGSRWWRRGDGLALPCLALQIRFGGIDASGNADGLTTRSWVRNLMGNRSVKHVSRSLAIILRSSS